MTLHSGVRVTRLTREIQDGVVLVAAQFGGGDQVTFIFISTSCQGTYYLVTVRKSVLWAWSWVPCFEMSGAGSSQAPRKAATSLAHPPPMPPSVLCPVLLWSEGQPCLGGCDLWFSCTATGWSCFSPAFFLVVIWLLAATGSRCQHVEHPLVVTCPLPSSSELLFSAL